MSDVLKSLSSKLPTGLQQELKRRHFARQIRNGTFLTDEAEYQMLSQWVRAGDWVLDVGANIGHYTHRMSELVGDQGRVIAFEPVPETFELLAANTALFPRQNVTLINIAASTKTRLLGMDIPKFDTGLDNYYMAHLTEEGAARKVLCASIDGLGLETISLVKIDAEGHELEVLGGMTQILERDRPVLIVEVSGAETPALLHELGYVSRREPNSSNVIFEHPRAGREGPRAVPDP